MMGSWRSESKCLHFFADFEVFISTTVCKYFNLAPVGILYSLQLFIYLNSLY